MSRSDPAPDAGLPRSRRVVAERHVTTDTFDYAARDHEVVDYETFVLPGHPEVELRGPMPDLDAGDWFTCIGAAQTMGIYVPRPYPVLLGERLGVASLNLGVGAGWPEFYTTNHPELLEWANRGRFVVLQAMSARGGASSWFEPTGRTEELRSRTTGDVFASVEAFRHVKQTEPDRIGEYVEELRHTWISTNLELVSRLDVPVILFYFSTRDADTRPDVTNDDPFEAMGEFPQLVDARCLDAVAEACIGRVDCLSTRNFGHELVSRFTGKPVSIDHAKLWGRTTPPDKLHRQFLSATHNDYYPSPEMHVDATDALAAGIARLLNDSFTAPRQG